jgi:hypothetical protein
MIEIFAAGRAGTPDEVGTVGALLMAPEGALIFGRQISEPIGRRYSAVHQEITAGGFQVSLARQSLNRRKKWLRPVCDCVR